MVGHRGMVSALGRVFSWKLGVEDGVTCWSVSFTGGPTAEIIISSVGVDVVRVGSVFAFLGVAGPVTVNDSWEREKALSELDSSHSLSTEKTWN